MSYTKYYLYKKQYSTDSGQTWYDVVPEETVPSGDPVGHYSTLEECEAGEPIYRWIDLDPSTDYYCSGTTKMYKQQKQYSTDSGATWHNVEPAEYREGGVAETGSTDCGYVPPTGNTKFSAVYSNGDTFELECNGNTTLYITETQPSGYDRTAMKSAVVGDCVDTLYGTFMNCTSLSSVTIPDTVHTIREQSFFYCTSLSSIDIPTGVTSIGAKAFEGDELLRTITLPSGLTAISDNTFNGCKQLRSISIPSPVLSIGASAFTGCIRLNSLTFEGTHIDTIGESAFNGCTSLSDLVIPNSVSTIGAKGFMNCTALSSVTFGNSVATIGSNSFSGCTNLTTLNIPDSVTTIGSMTFNGCTGLTEITIGSGLLTLGALFVGNANNLASVTIMATTPPAFDSTSIKPFDLNTSNCPIFVKDEVVQDYKTDIEWNVYADRLFPLSQKP